MLGRNILIALAAIAQCHYGSALVIDGRAKIPELSALPHYPGVFSGSESVELLGLHLTKRAAVCEQFDYEDAEDASGFVPAPAASTKPSVVPAASSIMIVLPSSMPTGNPDPPAKAIVSSIKPALPSSIAAASSVKKIVPSSLPSSNPDPPAKAIVSELVPSAVHSVAPVSPSKAPANSVSAAPVPAQSSAPATGNMHPVSFAVKPVSSVPINGALPSAVPASETKPRICKNHKHRKSHKLD